jgi:exosortase A
MRKAISDGSTHTVSDNRVPLAAWRLTGSILIVTISCVVAIFWQTVEQMILIWANSRTFAHGFLVLPATAYLIWSYRDVWVDLESHPSAYGLGSLLFPVSGWLVGNATDVVWLQQAAVVAMLPGLMWALLGKEVIRPLLWPLGFLVFLIPVGTALEPWLQDFTAWFIRIGLHLAGIPYLYEPHRIELTSGTWTVDPDCAGLRYLLPGLALAYAFVTLVYRRPARRLLFLTLCTLVLMLANGIRAYSVILGDHFGIADGTDHRVFSYAVYGLTMPLLLWLGLYWQENAKAPLIQHRELEAPQAVNTGETIIGETIVMAIAAVTVLALAPLSIWLWNHQ